MIELMSGKTHYWQWDTNQKLIIVNPAIEEVHFSNDLSITALVCAVYEEDGVRVVDVPNVLLQTCNTIRVYAVCDDCTMYQEHIKVYRRSKPDDYVYTETEIKRYEDLEARITNLEMGGGVDVDLTNYYTKEETNAAIEEATKEKVYELIETITPEEEMVIERTQEPDGTPYNFAALLIIIKKPNGMSHPSRSTGVITEDGANIQLYIQETSATSVEMYFAVEIKPVYGLYEVSRYPWSLITAPAQVYTCKADIVNQPCKTRGNIVGWNSRGTLMPAGITINIYGVRADA